MYMLCLTRLRGLMRSRPCRALFVFLCVSSSLSARTTKQTSTPSTGTVTTVPTLAYATYLGRTSLDIGRSVAVGADGSVYVAGVAAATSANRHGEAFVAHLSADGSTLLYLVYWGGSNDTEARALALDSAGNVYVTGETRAPDFPVRNAVQAHCNVNVAHGCLGNAFLTKLNPDGSVAFSTYWGGS